MEFITPSQMAEEERRAAVTGVSVGMLMENAGRAVAEEVLRKYRPGGEEEILVVAGTGNNGGDGLVAARHLWMSGVRTSVVLLSTPEAIRTAEARRNFDRLLETGTSVHMAVDVGSLRRLAFLFDRARIIIAAILGTGIRGKVREPMAEAIRMVNISHAVKVAVDVPSGLDPLTGDAGDEVVRAQLTITLHKAKVGLRDRREYTGEIVVAPIGIPG